MLNLYLISQSVNNDYDTYDSAVVAAASEDEARLIYPSNSGPDNVYWNGSQWRWHLKDGRILDYSANTWTSPDNVSVKFLSAGYEGQAGTVLASFNAG